MFGISARAKVVLLDDVSHITGGVICLILEQPLSALDAHTARHVFDKLICGPLMKGRTIVRCFIPLVAKS